MSITRSYDGFVCVYTRLYLSAQPLALLILCSDVVDVDRDGKYGESGNWYKSSQWSKWL